MRAIAAHFRYISKNGRLDIEDDRGVVERGKEAVQGIERQWKLSGSLIEGHSLRREALNIMLSMPRGTDPLIVQRAAREFARIELSDHRYVMVLHDHQANPHVHLSVRAESKLGQRLNPRKADLQRWRETFAAKLQGWGIEAEATRQATRGRHRNPDPLWRIKAREEGRLRTGRATFKSGAQARATRAAAVQAWMQIGKALAESGDPGNLRLAQSIKQFIQDMPITTSPVEQGAPKRERAGPGRIETTSARDTPRSFDR